MRSSSTSARCLRRHKEQSRRAVSQPSCASAAARPGSACPSRAVLVGVPHARRPAARGRDGRSEAGLVHRVDQPANTIASNVTRTAIHVGEQPEQHDGGQDRDRDGGDGLQQRERDAGRGDDGEACRQHRERARTAASASAVRRSAPARDSSIVSVRVMRAGAAHGVQRFRCRSPSTTRARAARTRAQRRVDRRGAAGREQPRRHRAGAARQPSAQHTSTGPRGAQRARWPPRLRPASRGRAAPSGRGSGPRASARRTGRHGELGGEVDDARRSASSSARAGGYAARSRRRRRWRPAPDRAGSTSAS